MKQLWMAALLAAGLVSCGSQSSDTENSADSTNMTDANQAPMGDTTGAVSNKEGMYPTDTSNQNGDDSVKGTSPASRSTTPRNTGNQGGGM